MVAYRQKKKMLVKATVLLAAGIAVSCNRLEKIQGIDSRFEPISPDIVLNDVPFKVRITEKRFCKVINWTLEEGKGLDSDYGRSGDFAVTDWNEVSAEVISDNPDFKGVKVKSEGGGIIVECSDTTGDGRYKRFILKRNKDNKDSVKNNRITFYTGKNPEEGHKCIMDGIEAAEYIDITGLRIKVRTLPAYEYRIDNNCITLTDKTIPSTHPCYYDIDKEFEFGWGYHHSDLDKGCYRFNAANSSEFNDPWKLVETTCPVQVTVLEPVPANTSWRIVDILCATRNIPQRNNLIDAYPEINWMLGESFPENFRDDMLYGLDWDDVYGKSILMPSFQFGIVVDIKPEKDSGTIGGWKKTHEVTSNMHFVNGIRDNWKTIDFFSVSSYESSLDKSR